MTKKILLSTIFVFLLLTFGCRLIQTPPKHLDCPVVTQDCKSTDWKGITVDTSLAYREVANQYYVFESVKQINSPEDEWLFSFIDKKRAILTFTDGDLNKVMITKFVRENSVRIESGIGVPLEGSIGAMSVRKNKVAFACSNNDIVLGNSDIYYGELKGNILTNVESLGKQVNNDPAIWSSHPALSPDGNLIIYATTRFLGTGEIDLWFTFKNKDGKWEHPINCGKKVNSRCDELTPFISQDGNTLLFASGGHNSVGGYDIYKSKISPDLWKLSKSGDWKSLNSHKELFSKAENLRKPLNTPYDELFPSSPGDYDELLYYSTNQETQSNKSIIFKKGGFDMYVRKLITKHIAKKDKEKTDEMDYGFDVDMGEDATIEPVFTASKTYILKGTIYNARTRKPAENAEIIIREIRLMPGTATFAKDILDNKDKKYKIVELEKDREFEISAQGKDLVFDKFKLRVEKNDTVMVVKAGTNSQYIVDLEKDREFEITAQAKDLFFDSFKMSVEPENTIKEIVKDFYIPETLALRVNFPSNNYDNPYKFTIDSNGVETNVTWLEELDLVAQNIKISENRIEKIVLIGHTDMDGQPEYNVTLGKNRVDFIVSELLRRGVKKDILEAKSDGEESPLIQKDGESEELFKKRLRRVELTKFYK